MTATRLAALLAVVVLALAPAGCATSSEDIAEDTGADATQETPSPSPAAEDDPEGRVPPEEAPAPPGDAPLAEGLDVTLPAVGGGQVVGAELAGRDLALWFWAPW
ncbi:MAG: hypothetical protein WD250_03310 [Egibacteraceae bacterium]